MKNGMERYKRIPGRICVKRARKSRTLSTGRHVLRRVLGLESLRSRTLDSCTPEKEFKTPWWKTVIINSVLRFVSTGLSRRVTMPWWGSSWRRRIKRRVCAREKNRERITNKVWGEQWDVWFAYYGAYYNIIIIICTRNIPVVASCMR